MVNTGTQPIRVDVQPANATGIALYAAAAANSTLLAIGGDASNPTSGGAGAAPLARGDSAATVEEQKIGGHSHQLRVGGRWQRQCDHAERQAGHQKNEEVGEKDRQGRGSVGVYARANGARNGR